jgi:hypothetical protein
MKLFEENPAGRWPLPTDYTMRLIDQDSGEPLSITHKIFWAERFLLVLEFWVWTLKKEKSDQENKQLSLVVRLRKDGAGKYANLNFFYDCESEFVQCKNTKSQQNYVYM